MAKKLTYEEISTDLRTFVDATDEHFGNYAYAAGALQVQLAFVLAQLPAHKQQETIQVFAQLTAKYSPK